MKDDPSDDELDRDVERTMGRSPLFAPKLDSAPRTQENGGIDLRAMREAGELMPSDVLRERARAEQPPPARSDAQALSPLRLLAGAGARSASVPSGLAPSPLAKAAPVVSDVTAWDRYAAAALALTAHLEDPEAAAAVVADRLLAERRRRFG